MTGFTDEQIIGKTVDEVIPGEEVEFIERKSKAKSSAVVNSIY